MAQPPEDGAVRETPSVAAARQIDDRDVIERDVAQQLVRAELKAQIVLGGGAHRHGQRESLLNVFLFAVVILMGGLERPSVHLLYPHQGIDRYHRPIDLTRVIRALESQRAEHYLKARGNSLASAAYRAERLLSRGSRHGDLVLATLLTCARRPNPHPARRGRGCLGLAAHTLAASRAAPARR